MDHGVELGVQPGVEVVAGPFGLRPVDDADGAFQPRAGKPLAALLVEWEQEALVVGLVEQLLVANGKGGPDVLAVGGATPLGGGRDLAVMGGETDQQALAGPACPCQLPDVQSLWWRKGWLVVDQSLKSPQTLTWWALTWGGSVKLTRVLPLRPGFLSVIR